MNEEKTLVLIPKTYRWDDPKATWGRWKVEAGSPMHSIRAAAMNCIAKGTMTPSLIPTELYNLFWPDGRPDAPKCECGGDTARTTHSYWCPKASV